MRPFTPAAFPLALAPDFPIRAPAFILEELRVRERNEELQGALQALGAEVRERWGDLEIGALPGIQAIRGMYRALGLDPTRTRPSSEALLRRLLKGQALYTVNTLVDALNLSSARHRVPFGLYDLDALRPPISLRLGGAGEGYAGIRKERVNLEGRPCLVDAAGPFGNPSSDSDRSKITLASRRALVVAFLPRETPPEREREILANTAATLLRYSGPPPADATGPES